MIRTTITAHIPAASLKELTFQINDRNLGALALQRQQNYVMTGNRRVQMVTGLLTDRKRQSAVAEDKYQLRQWESAFRDLQIGGLVTFPEVVEREHLRCDLLCLLDDQRFIGYTTPRFGIYLNRSNRLFRVQPIANTVPPHFFGLDLYSFDVEAGDNILVMSPEFIDLFDAAELIEQFMAFKQVPTVMSRLSDLAETYGEGLVKPWLSFQVQRTQEDQAHSDALPLKSGKRYPHNIGKSKVVRLENGNVFIAVNPAHQVVTKHEQREKIHLVEPEPDQIPLEPKHGFFPSGSRTLLESERQTTRLDRLKARDVGGASAQKHGFLHRLLNLFPGQVLLSRVVFIALILVVLVMLVLGGQTLLKRNSLLSNTETTTTATVSDEPNTLRTDYEIELEVKASNLSVYAQGGEGRLIGTVMKGERIWKLSEPIDDWVMVRLEDGRTGFVYAPVLDK